MSSRSTSSSRLLARLVAVLVALVAAALLFGLAAHHDDLSSASVSGTAVESLDTAASAPPSAAESSPGSDELLACSLAVLCCIAFLARRRSPRRAEHLRSTRAFPQLAERLPSRAQPRQALPLEILSISRT